METKDRMRLLRKEYLGLTMESFGERIMASKAAISRMESGSISITDKNIQAICREFNVNEDWLRNGIGEPFVQRTRSEEIRQFIDEIEMAGSDDFRNRLVSALSRLDESDWAVLAKVAAQMVADQDNGRPAEGSPESVAAAEAAYEKALGIAPPTRSSVSSTGDEEKQDA